MPRKKFGGALKNEFCLYCSLKELAENESLLCCICTLNTNGNQIEFSTFKLINSRLKLIPIYISISVGDGQHNLWNAVFFRSHAVF